MKHWALRHAQVLFATLGQLARAPFATLLTVAVIGITLALPAGLYVGLDNIEAVSAGWGRGAQVSVFLKSSTSEQNATTLAQRLRRQPGIIKVDYISREAALAEFKRLSGFGDALDVLASNPLPPVLVVHPALAYSKADPLRTLVGRLRDEPGVDLVQVDLEWVQRLQAILDLAQRAVVLLATLLALAVVLIIGNTTRLAVLNRRTEIEIIKLIGGTAAFIRRPFLYAGLLQGLAGAVSAWALLSLGLALLSGPIQTLSGLYGSQFSVAGLGIRAALALIATGGLLGWLGARLAVGRHLRSIEPQ
jgi:cell division transport system permease protein